MPAGRSRIAFYLTVLQGFSRTSNLSVGRDRVIGILLGNVLMTRRVRVAVAGAHHARPAAGAVTIGRSARGDAAPAITRRSRSAGRAGGGLLRRLWRRPANMRRSAASRGATTSGAYHGDRELVDSHPRHRPRNRGGAVATGSAGRARARWRRCAKASPAGCRRCRRRSRQAPDPGLPRRGRSARDARALAADAALTAGDAHAPATARRVVRAPAHADRQARPGSAAMMTCARAGGLAALSFCSAVRLRELLLGPRAALAGGAVAASGRARRAPFTRLANPAIQPGRVYSLPELIDIAESANPDTRIGWERARRAALAVGIAKAEYFPVISALTIVGYQHVFFPAPTSAVDVGSTRPRVCRACHSPSRPVSEQSGYIGVDTFQVLPFLSVRWPLLDLGRGDAVKAAENLSVAANAMFTAAHQKMIFDVARAYFRLGAARAQVAVNRDALERTRAIAKAADARYAQGVATVVELSEAKREVAQAEYNLTQATGGRDQRVRDAGVGDGHRPGRPAQRRHQPEPGAAQPARREGRPLRGVRAREATGPAVPRAPGFRPPPRRCRGASRPTGRASPWPAPGAPRCSAPRSTGSRMKTVTIPNLTIAAIAEWMVFDGGLRDLQKEIARSQHSEAEQELLKLEQQIVQEVMTATTSSTPTCLVTRRPRPCSARRRWRTTRSPSPTRTAWRR